MAKLAFIGLGLMGTPMATRLLEAGHDLTVWNRTADKTRPLTDQGATAASTPMEAIAGVDAVITMVTNAEALEQVVFGDNGLAAALAPGQLLIDMSTVGPDAVRSVASRLPQGVAMVDAPVRGSVPQATAGKLAVYVGADLSGFQRVEPILAPLGTLHHVGGLGAGAATKVVVNSTLGAAIAAFGEALALGDDFGLDRSVVLDVLSDTPIASTVEAKRANVESGSYPASFKLSLALKDLNLVTQIADQNGRRLEVAPASRDWLEQAAEAGAGDLDYSAVIATITTDGGRRPA
ncbi:3-hydroxyisobutyrate dehydrogenase [Kribbella orskensis]|uniref:3-hydroxyisobutyrate dehydrogenase n=1 Tax=Kribbella orskensis TaxID=2512216 RepID=A0ABY2BA43_9ACTN|nr:MULTISPECIES: NAD(P)-dependent oxidoreductase [Kribbella]TCN32874.1 3-hydroxyisobutyrate dehydrogenase [Kribbella sp. VKM Ac-2500]TCO13252.1 3-hydroxyisobutyrate dehydrogenase [Kribbella orskensis]